MLDGDISIREKLNRHGEDQFVHLMLPQHNEIVTVGKVSQGFGTDLKIVYCSFKSNNFHQNGLRHFRH